MSELPPGPSSTLLSTYKIGKSPFEFYRACVEEYGHIFTVPAMNGTVVCTTEPQDVRTIFSTSTDHFEPFGAEAAEAIAPHSIFLLHGARHKEERKLLAPPFHGTRMKVYAEEMRDATLDTIATWRPGQRLVLLDELQHISLDVILRAIFGVEKGERLEKFRVGVKDLVGSFSPSFLFFKILQHEFGGVGPFARFKRSEATFDELIYGVIKERRDTGRRGEDILSLMLEAQYEDGSAMSDAQVRDELVTLLIAGHETTAITMSWVLDHLARDKAVLDRLTEEVDGLPADHEAEACTTLPYLTAVCYETLRLHPVLSEIIRQLVKPISLQGHTIPAGVGVAALFSVIHTREDLFEDAMAFKPERFIDRSYPTNHFFPFGGAPRRCIGSSFALFEMKIALATILRHCRFELADPEPVGTVRRNLIMGPEGGVSMTLVEKRL